MDRELLATAELGGVTAIGTFDPSQSLDAPVT
jgi:hypothetical protein